MNFLPTKRRTMREFAEQEVVIPDGPYKGRKFRCDRQPFAKLFFDAVDTSNCRRIAILGPTQSGKSFLGFVIPILYHLFECRETVIVGVPNANIAKDKWEQDILPAIEASAKFRALLPTTGEGSRGGSKITAVKFANGATLRFMTGGSDDSGRSGATARVVVITEVDKLDLSSSTSREADKITQLERRTDSHGDQARIYLECTVSYEQGRIWREYQQGTCSKIVRPCPHCDEWVTPERDDLKGWSGVETELQAKRCAYWSCPACGKAWTEQQRREANYKAKLIHKGQTISKNGTVIGPFPETETLGIRWTAIDNHFWKAGDVGIREWKAKYSPDEENSEKEMRQFVWALPYIPPTEDLTKLDPQQITKRVLPITRGIVPSTSTLVTVGIDAGKYRLHWVAISWHNGSPHIFDYDAIEMPTRELGAERALIETLRKFRETLGRLQPEQVWIDSGYLTEHVYSFCAESGSTYHPTKGLGISQVQDRKYTRPKTTGALVAKVGNGWHIAKVKHRNSRIRLVEINADYWKSWLADRLQLPIGKPGALTLYNADPLAHLTFAQHLASEKQVEEYIPGKGVIIRWEQVRKHNHYLDATYLACAAGDYCGVAQLVEATKPKPKLQEAQAKKPVRRKRSSWATRGGREF